MIYSTLTAANIYREKVALRLFSHCIYFFISFVDKRAGRCMRRASVVLFLSVPPAGATPVPVPRNRALQSQPGRGPTVPELAARYRGRRYRNPNRNAELSISWSRCS